MVEGGEFTGGEGHGVHQIGQQPDDLAPPARYSITLTRTPPGCAPFCPARFIRARYVPSSKIFTGRRATLDRARISRCALACVYAFHSATPGKPRSMITSIPAALPAIAIASSGSPPRNPPTLASIDECVPVSVNVTTLAWGEPRWLTFCARRPAE